MATAVESMSDREKMLREKIKDSIFGVVLLGVGIFALVDINVGQPSSPAPPGAITYASFPTMLSVLLILLAFGYLASSLMAVGRLRRSEGALQRVDGTPAADGGEDEEEIEPVDKRLILIRTAGTLVFLLSYVFLIMYVEFTLATILFLFVMFYLYGQRSLVRIAAMSVVGGGALGAFFLHVLHLPL